MSCKETLKKNNKTKKISNKIKKRMYLFIFYQSIFFRLAAMGHNTPPYEREVYNFDFGSQSKGN